MEKGFSLIDVLVGVALLLVLFLALFGILRASLAVSSLSKAKAVATELANSQIEYLRGLSYDNIGTVGGIPAGVAAQFATSTIGSVPYSIRTFVQYVDNPADGTGVGDTNAITTDYKIGKVTVSYTIYGQTRHVSLVSTFAPPGTETSLGGGTLVLRVVDATGASLPGASVRVVNASTSPTVDFTTTSNISGYVTLGGSATSSQYQIFVSRGGYSSAQTYARTSQNANPNPGYLTVVKDQTTSATFAIDRLANVTFTSVSPATVATFLDSFTTAGNLASQSNTQVSGGALTLASGSTNGTARSVPIAPGYLAGWGILSATRTTPTGTSLVLHVADTSGNLIPDTALAGNTAGFSTFPVSLAGLNIGTYPGISLVATLGSSSTTTTPSLLDWSISHSETGVPVPNTVFNLTGTKTVGTDSGGVPLYKTLINDSTGATGTKTLSLEWDTYTESAVTNLIESCPVSPLSITPGSISTTTLLVGTQGTHTLGITSVTSSGAPLPSTTLLTKAGYAATVQSSPCGFAFFNNLTTGTYTATISAPGYATTTLGSVSVTGHATTTVTLTP